MILFLWTACNMSVVDGFEASRIILDMRDKKHIKDVVIIASTANASPLDYEACFKCGMVDFLSKPFTKNQMREKIDQYM
jgi:CheY-like chemotaxis protein